MLFVEFRVPRSDEFSKARRTREMSVNPAISNMPPRDLVFERVKGDDRLARSERN